MICFDVMKLLIFVIWSFGFAFCSGQKQKFYLLEFETFLGTSGGQLLMGPKRRHLEIQHAVTKGIGKVLIFS